MLFKEAKELFAIRFKDFDLDSPEGQSKSEKYINLALKDIYRADKWEFRKRIGQIVLIPNYETGTCTITKYDGTNEAAAKTVTFSGSTLTQAMVGRYFQPDGSQNWYKIVRIDGSTAYLESPNIDSQPSSGEFKIWKRFYYLPSDVDVVESFKNWDKTGWMDLKSYPNLASQVRNTSTEGNPFSFSPHGIDPYDDVTYSAGTISATKNSNVFTGSGTAFLSNNIQTGDILEFSGIQFKVKRVEADDRIITYQYIKEDVAGGATYEIKKDNPVGFQFYYAAEDYRIVEFTYYRRGHDLYNQDKEEIYLPNNFNIALLDRAQALYMKDMKDSGWVNVQNAYALELVGLKWQKQVVNAPYRQFAPQLKNMPGRI